MGEEWYKDIPDDYFETETDKAYREAFARIREGLAKGLGFDSACNTIEVEDEELRKIIITDMLKVLIAEEHFANKVPLEDLASRLKVEPDRLELTRASMLDEVGDVPLKNYNTNSDPGRA
jgi:deoxyhypusine synthase